MRIDDEYLGYCLDEAVHLIMVRMQNKEEPMFRKKCSSFTELYKQYN